MIDRDVHKGPVRIDVGSDSLEGDMFITVCAVGHSSSSRQCGQATRSVWLPIEIEVTAALVELYDRRIVLVNVHRSTPQDGQMECPARLKFARVSETLAQHLHYVIHVTLTIVLWTVEDTTVVAATFVDNTNAILEVRGGLAALSCFGPLFHLHSRHR